MARVTYPVRLLTEAVELYSQGKSARQVLDELEARHGVRPSECWLYSWLSKRGATRPKSAAQIQRWSEARDWREADVLRMRYFEELPIKAIAKRLGCGTQTVRSILARGDDEPVERLSLSYIHSRRAGRPARRAEVVKLRREGLTYRAIQERTGACREAIHEALYRVGMATKRAA